MRPIPESLAIGPFTPQDAIASGVTRHMLRGKRFRSPAYGVYTAVSLPDTLRDRCRALSLVLPPDATFSHETALALGGWLSPTPGGGGYRYAREPDSTAPIHVTVPAGRVRPQGRGVIGHRSDLLTGDVLDVGGIRLTSPWRTWCDLGTSADEVDLVILADALRRRFADGERRLNAQLDQWSGRRGARGLRRALARSRDRVDSPMETRLRLIFEDAGLPEPTVNEWVRDANGDPVHRPDLSWPTWKVAADYDGTHHNDRDSLEDVRDGRRSNWRQRQDASRHDLLDEVDWALRVFTSFHVLRAPEIGVRRMRDALRLHGADV